MVKNCADTTDSLAPSPNPSLADAAREAIEQDYIRLFQATSDPDWTSQEAPLKAARIGARRLRATLQLLGPYLQPKAARRLVRELELLTTALGAARDLDVIIAELRTAAEDDSRLSSTVQLLDRERLRANARVSHRLTSTRLLQLHSRLNRYSASLGRPDLHFRDVAGKIVWRRYQETAQRAETADPANLASVHAVRRSLRRLRYALECFGTRLIVPKPLLTVLKRAQDHLGVLNDNDVAIATLKPLLEHLPDDVARLALREFIATRKQAIATSLETVEPVIRGLITPEFQTELTEVLSTLREPSS